MQPVEGQTLNAVTFRAIIESFGWQSAGLESGLLWVVLALEGGLLFVAANTGFLGGPAVLANMAADSWVPHMYRYLSTRLVTQNGILLMGVAALGILDRHRRQGGAAGGALQHQRVPDLLAVAAGTVHLLVASTAARITLAPPPALSARGLIVTGSILLVTLIEKFTEGGWMTVLITGTVIAFCLLNHAHYAGIKRKIRIADEALSWTDYPAGRHPPQLDPRAPTAVFVVGSSRSGGV